MSPNTLLRIPILMLENMKLKMKKSIQQKWYRFAMKDPYFSSMIKIF